jgi:hypothetical protein
MAGSPQPVGSREQSVLDKGFSDQLKASTSQFSQMNQGYQQAANTAAGQVQTNFNQFNPSMATNFQQHAPQLQTNFQTGPQLDARAQGILSAAESQRAAQTSTQNRQIASQFNNNPGLVNILQSQADMRGRLNANPLLFQAAADQTQRQQQEGLLGNQAQLQQSQQGAALQQMGNQAGLQKAEVGANLQGAGNAALGQQLQFQAQPVNSQQNLMSVLSNMAQLYGYRQATPMGPDYQTTYQQAPFGGAWTQTQRQIYPGQTTQG